MHVNKVHYVTTISRVVQDLGEDEDWLQDVAIELEIEDGAIWVYGVGEDDVHLRCSRVRFSRLPCNFTFALGAPRRQHLR